jgi:3-dehydroquinate dehydratase/shikimate dehydrogenase
MEEMNRTRICVPVCAPGVSELKAAFERAMKVGDFVELRLDCLAGGELAILQRDLQTLLPSFSRPLILTLRPAEQGGRLEIDNLTRVIFWTQYFAREQQPHVWADVELDLMLLFQERLKETSAVLNWQRVICSHHDFTGAGLDAAKIYEQMSGTPARILKIAVQVRDITDCLPLFQLLERARNEGRELIAIAMGQAGLLTRILGPSRGAYLTYGSLDEEHQTAPGQINAAQLRSLYRVERLDRQAMITGLVGSPIAHSVSPQMHNAAFKATDSNAVYIPFEVQNLGAFVRRMVHPRTRELDWNLRGLGVTAPYKTAIIEHLNFVEPSAAEIGAVNTIVINEEELRGYNTDVTAFVKTLSERLGTLRGLRCAVIGAGGAARAALRGLQQEGAQSIVFARAADSARALAEKFGSSFAPLAEARFDGFDVVINSTPLGTRGPLENETPAAASQLRGARLAYDLVYNPAETRFIRAAREAGCETMGGLSMLVAQAAEQFQLWTEEEAPIELMRAAAQAALDMAHANATDE